jgi:hypothetical protein
MTKKAKAYAVKSEPAQYYLGSRNEEPRFWSETAPALDRMLSMR